MGATWRFLIDENLHPPIVRYLADEQIDAAYVPEVLWEGADDIDDVLPFAREHDYIVVTSDIRDFGELADGGHEGIILVYDGTLESYAVFTGLLNIVEAYSDRDVLRGIEVLDSWL